VKQPLSASGDPAVWEKLWREAAAASPVVRRDRQGPEEELASWNRRAHGYARHSRGADGRSWRAALLRWRASRGALDSQTRVLDIGAGPGTYALPMASRVRRVTALEPASAMAAILERERRRRGLSNIRIVQRTWQQVDLAELNWQGAFELVFAAQTPGIDGPEALEKMLAASCGYCFLSAWAGPLWGPWGQARRELWPRLFKEEPGGYPNDVLYPFGWLYAKGYRPELRFRTLEVRRDLPREEAEQELTAFFERYTDLTDRVRKVIAAYVQERTRGGRFRQESQQHQGCLLWEAGPAATASAAPGRTPARSRSRSRCPDGGRIPGSASRSPRR